MERPELISLLRATGCAVEEGGFFFLVDPNASAAERTVTEQQISMARSAQSDPRGGWLCLRTGGSGGTVKFARHDENTLRAAVDGFCAHFKMARVNAVDVLPAHHVSGLMARVRCAATRGEHRAWDWKRLDAGDLPEMIGDEWVVSLVPTQLHRLLSSKKTVAWLQRLRIIFLGGGPVGRELAEQAAAARLRVALTYGMTETAAMIAALQPEEFLAGARTSGIVMPHARVTIDPVASVITVDGSSVFRGYWPDWRDARDFTTEDVGRVDDRGHLHILGRRDAMIITGGKKVNAIEVEAALRASGEFGDLAVIGVPDAEWGERVVACFAVDSARAPDLARAVAGMAPHQRPKQFVPIAEWPRNALGKVNRAWLLEQVKAKR